MADNTTDNPLANIFQFYFNLAEQIAPVIKQGIEDWFTVYTKLWGEAFRVQGEFLKQFTGSKTSTEFSDRAKEFGEKIMETQKNVSTDLVDAALKGVQSLKGAANKATEENK